jgi:NTP pyrophosphatase (non-canonical NTP hydrolase)
MPTSKRVVKKITPAQSRALESLADHVYGVAKKSGFHSKKTPNVGNFVSNLHSEVSEFWEAYRKNQVNKPCDKSPKCEEMGLGTLTNGEEELADILIRVLDTAKTLGINIGRAVHVKDAYNQTRPFKHGNKKA